jgi:hypothetical protein
MYGRSRPQYRPDLGRIWAVHSMARSPDRPGLHRGSLTFGATARLRLFPPHRLTAPRRIVSRRPHLVRVL